MTSLTTYANVQKDCIQLVNCIQLANMRFSLGKALFEWGIERLRVITVIVGLCSPPPTVVFPDFRDWRAALSSAGPAALHYSSDLLDRWLGNIKSLLSAGAGPGSGGGDWGKGYTLAGCRLAGWCWWWESEKWPIFFFFLSPNTKQILMKVLLIHGSCPVQPRLNPSLIWWFILV